MENKKDRKHIILSEISDNISNFRSSYNPKPRMLPALFIGRFRIKINYSFILTQYLVWCQFQYTRYLF